MPRQIFKTAHNKEMSLVVGIKCTDGVAIGSDSLITFTKGGTIKSEKIFANDNLIVACFNCLSFSFQGKDCLVNDLMKLLFNQSNFTYEILLYCLKLFLNNQDSNNIYEFLIAYKENKKFHLKHLRCFNGIIKGEDEDLNSFVLHTPNGIMNLLIEKPLKVKEAEVIIEKIIKNTIELQKDLMNDIYVDNPVLTYSLAYTHTHEG